MNMYTVYNVYCIYYMHKAVEVVPIPLHLITQFSFMLIVRK